MSGKVKIVEVGVRDGLQNEVKHFSVQERWRLVEFLTDAGLSHIEVGAFVSSKWVPQMRGSEKLAKKAMIKSKKLKHKVTYSALVPNKKGMEDALKTGIKEVAIFGACSETFSKKNINCSVKESFNRFEAVLKMAKQHKVKVRGYLSMAFGCAYEGKVSEAQVIKLAEKMLNMGVYEVSLGDTVGVANPMQVRRLLNKMSKKIPLKHVALHMHDTRGTALANVLAGLDCGVKTFDSSIGGLGGCPYAGGATGNLATEDLCFMLQSMGFKTGVDVKKLIEIHSWIQKRLDHKLPSHVGRAGLPRIHK